MSRTAISVLVFGVYMVCLGLVLVVVPNVFLRTFWMPPTTEVWVRVVGLLLLCLALYYVQAARWGLTEFFRLTVAARCFSFLCLGLFAALRLAAPVLALFGAVDLAGAIWTAVCLRQARAAAPAA